MGTVKENIEIESAEKITTFQKLAAFALLLYPIFQTYGMPGVNSSIAYMFSTLLGFVCILKKIATNSFSNNVRKVPKYLTYFFVYAILSRFITSGIEIPIGLIISVLFAYLYFENINFEFFLKAYTVIALICIAFFWLQELSFLTIGIRPSGLIPGLSVIVSDDSTANFAEHLAKYASRSTSFFSEPAHFAQFLLPLLCLELLGPRKSIVKSAFIVVTLLYLRSGNALLGLAVVSFVYILQLFKGGMKLRQKLMVLMVVLAAGFVGVSFMNSENGQELMSRENEVTDSEQMGSGFVRIYRGYWLFADFDLTEKMLGVNDGDKLEQHIKRLPDWTFSYGQTDYFNGVQYLLIHTGFIGTFLFLLLYLSLWKKNDLCGRSCILNCIALSFIAAIHLTPFMYTCLLIARFRQLDSLGEDNVESDSINLQTTTI